MQRFAQKVCVIVGGNSGIGRAAARAFANEGAQVVITGRDPTTLQSTAEEIGCGTVAHRSDITNLRDISDLFARVGRSFGRIDVLYVNAGVGALRPIQEVTEAMWDWVHDTNLKGAFFCVQAALPLMSTGAVIVLTGSTAALKGDSEATVYASSKAGLRALGRSLSIELAEQGIRVNVVSPGPVDTPMLQRIEGLATMDVAALKQGMIRATPLKRIAAPEEIAEAVLFLSSPAAGFITGIELIIDGGNAGL